MALTRLFATGQQLGYGFLSATGFPVTVDIPRAQLIADCAPGPLQDLIARVDDDGWRSLQEADEGEISIVWVPADSQPNYVGLSFAVPSPGVRVFRFDAVGGVNIRVKLQFVHSITR